LESQLLSKFFHQILIKDNMVFLKLKNSQIKVKT
jgi:hypothetical protein